MNRRAATVFTVVGVFLVAAGSASQPVPQPDPLARALRSAGIEPDQLGFDPKGYWTRYPDPDDIPYINLAFSDLLAEPLRIYDFTANIAVASELYLNPEALATQDDALIKAVYYAGVRHATAQFRAYSASLWAELDGDEPLLAAIRAIYESTGAVWRYNAMGGASDFPLIERDTRREIERLDPRLRGVIARTVLHLLHAHEWTRTARRNVDPADMQAVWRIRRLGETQFDGLEYYPELEDCARTLDVNSVYYAGRKLLQSGWLLADTLRALRDAADIDWRAQALNLSTPIGRIIVGGTGDDEHAYTDACLAVDLGGNDLWSGAAGATPALDIPVSLAIDLAGDDRYVNEREFLPAQGAAILGAGVLIDVDGDDSYTSRRLSQGASMLGYGVLADYAGDDSYRLWTSGQGGAYFGVGVALDGSGDDEYFIHGDGQGYGGVGGAGALVNHSGRDRYYAEPVVSDSVFRPDYHSREGSLNYSYAQGCGIGRRGDIGDGHSWAGGLGVLIDLHGDDEYVSANWSLGCGYWYGIGMLWDGDGDDRYRAAAWSSGAGAHFAIGAHIDEGGNDEVRLWEDSGYGIAFGHDYAVALHINRGGDDLYRVRGDGLAHAINMSQVFFIDTEGDDRYETGGNSHNYGWNNYMKNNPPPPGAFFHLFSRQVSAFLDLDGADRYTIVPYPDGPRQVDPRIGDARVRLIPEPPARDSLSHPGYHGIGVDYIDLDDRRIEAFRDKLRRP
ncbi:MAG: hypothetical protein MAG453_01916 [Calditrichaeota bacterium]|nr:hypothetical protein [Calditrichota bacterium]